MEWKYLLAVLLAPLFVKLIERWDERDRKKREGQPSRAFVFAFRCGGLVRQVLQKCWGNRSQMRGNELPTLPPALTHQERRETGIVESCASSEPARRE